MAFLAPSTPSEFGNQVDDLAEAYSPEQLQQKYTITKELKYLLALQKVTSIVQEAERSIAASQEQTEGNVKDQLERGLMERAEDVIDLLGGQQPQGQTRMVAQGGLINRASGGIVGYAQGTPPPANVEEEADTVDFADLAAQYGADAVSELADWASNNKIEAGLIGLSFIPYVGPGLSMAGRGALGAFKIGKKGYDWLKANKTAQNIADVAKKSVTKPKYKKLKEGEYGPPGDPSARVYSPGKGVGIVSAGAAASSMLGDDDDDDEEGIASIVEPEDQGQGPKPKTPTPGSTGEEDFNDLGILASRELPDYRGQAQQSADTVEDIAGGTDVYDLIKGRAFRDTSDVAQEGAEAFMGRADETGIRENLVNLFKEADADLAALNNPEEMARDLRIATFANVGGTGVGQIFGNMSKSFLETKAAQKELLRAAIEYRTGNALKVIELDRDLFIQSEDAGAALYAISEASKSEALTNISNFSRDRKRQVVDIADSLRRSDDARVRNILEAIKQEGAALERRGRADLTSYVAAQKQLDKIDALKREAFSAALATNPRYIELEQKKLVLQSEGETLTTEEQQELKTIKDNMEATIYGILSQAGLLNGEEAAKEIMAAKNPSLISDREDRFTTYRREALGAI